MTTAAKDYTVSLESNGKRVDMTGEQFDRGAKRILRGSRFDPDTGELEQPELGGLNDTPPTWDEMAEAYDYVERANAHLANCQGAVKMAKLTKELADAELLGLGRRLRRSRR